jgi:hypothetical protein
MCVAQLASKKQYWFMTGRNVILLTRLSLLLNGWWCGAVCWVLVPHSTLSPPCTGSWNVHGVAWLSVCLAATLLNRFDLLHRCKELRHVRYICWMM